MLSASAIKMGYSCPDFPLEEQTRGSRADHCPSGNWAQCKRGGETGTAGHPFTRGQHHANKIALNLQFRISQVGASKELHTLGNLASKGAGVNGKSAVLRQLPGSPKSQTAIAESGQAGCKGQPLLSG